MSRVPSRRTAPAVLASPIPQRYLPLRAPGLPVRRAIRIIDGSKEVLVRRAQLEVILTRSAKGKEGEQHAAFVRCERLEFHSSLAVRAIRC